ncbi:MAG: anaerobic ribonucleoside-triphosphate reductase activating protein [Candidatus Aenigmarchaeota archaeon]|nr:anaerobic ribonucleoside-triphosphate reductase activating protein [Candidatus Aenigmarchaeota archaeon]
MIPIKGLEKSSLIDYSGKVSAVIFLAGCNFRCPFCHNRDLVLNPDGTESIPEEEVLQFLKERKKWLDGAVVSGGEPTLHKDLPRFLGKIKELGYPVKLDTNGTNPGMLKEIMERGLADYIAMDIKAPLEKYEKSAGVKTDTKKIRESIRMIIGSGIGHEFRSTVLPALHTKEDVQEMARMVKGARKLYLQQFRPKNTVDPNFGKAKPFSEKEMLELRDLCSRYVNTEVRMA